MNISILYISLSSLSVYVPLLDCFIYHVRKSTEIFFALTICQVHLYPEN